MIRRTRSLDGEWQLRAHPGLEAALAAAVRDGRPRAAIHEEHLAADPGDVAAGWLPARVPGSVLDDLMRAGEVADLYHERNSRLAEWVARRAWTYRRTFELEALGARERAWLRFEGIDAAGHVFVDGRPLATSDGMFVPLEIEATDPLGGGGRHELAVVVEPAPASEPQVGRTSRVRVHKTRMSYGWDFCPPIVHQGLWQEVTLVTAGPVRIRDVWARPSLASDRRTGSVEIEVTLDIAVAFGGEVEVQARLGSAMTRSSPVENGSTVRLRLQADAPEPWWPNGLGRAALHDLRVTALVDGDVVDQRTVSIGFRTIERGPNPGAPDGARPWTFVVNGRPTEILGWNWTPLDALYGVPRPARLEHLLGRAAASGANLVRVWGGGLIETEAFYDACDRLGLLVWQEFSQSSSGIDDEPARDEAFVERMRREAEAIVPRRRNHPSLAIWCGGNELQGPGGPLEDAESPVLTALHEVVARLDPDRAWLPTSPSGPRFGNRLTDIESAPTLLHDVHGPWEHQGLRGQAELWNRGTSLFNGEFGVEGMANRRAHERLIAPDHRWPADRTNPIYRHLGDWWINEPLVQSAFGGRLGDLETLRRASQHLQAEGLRYAVEANRRRWPHNSGSIPWQLNESFPNAWCTAVIGHDGEPKPAFHAVARAYARTVVSAAIPGWALDGADRLELTPWAWSTEVEGDATVRCRTVASDGTTIDQGEASVVLDGRRPMSPGAVSLSTGRADGSVVLLDLRLEQAGALVAENRYVLGRGADLSGLLDLRAADLSIQLSRGAPQENVWCLSIANESAVAALGIVVADARPADTDGWADLEDNGLDVLPGESRQIRLDWVAAPEMPRRVRVSAWNVAERILE